VSSAYRRIWSNEEKVSTASNSINQVRQAMVEMQSRCEKKPENTPANERHLCVPAVCVVALFCKTTRRFVCVADGAQLRHHEPRMPRADLYDGSASSIIGGCGRRRARVLAKGSYKCNFPASGKHRCIFQPLRLFFCSGCGFPCRLLDSDFE